MCIFVYGAVTLYRTPFQTLPLTHPMDSVNDSVTNHTGFPHSEIAGYNGSYHLTDAYRRLARPSSPLTARASTVYA